MRNLKANRLLLIDILLIPIFIGVVVTGFGLHIAGEHAPHNIVMWLFTHTVFAILSLVSTFFHIKDHLGWYKGLFTRTKAKRCKLTIALSVIFLLTVLSGILIYLNPHLGKIHYLLGLILMVLSLIHLLKRLGWLIKTIRKK